MTELAERIREKLTVDEAEVIDRTLDRLSKLIGLTKNGKVVFKVDRGKTTTKTLLALYMAGKHMAKQAGYVEDDTVSMDELARELGTDPRIAAARASDLRREGKLINVGRGSYIINPSAIESIMSEAEKEQS